MLFLQSKRSSANTISEESEKLRRDVSLSHSKVAELEGLTKTAVRIWRRKHLKFSEYIKCTKKTDVWNSKHIAIAKYTKYTNKDVAKLIGRSVDSVRKWRERNLSDLEKEELLMLKGTNLKKDQKYEEKITRKSAPLGIKDIIIVAENMDKPTRDIAQLLGRPERSLLYIKKQMRELKELLNGIEDL